MRPFRFIPKGALPGLLLLFLPGLALAETGSLLPPPPGSLPVQPGSVDARPFKGLPVPPAETTQGTIQRGSTRTKDGTGDRLSRPSTSLPENDRTSSRSLGRLFDLKRQETLLKREIAVKKLKDELTGRTGAKSLKTPSKGSPVTLLAAGLPGHRYAVLVWPDGRRIRVRQGETLPDGERIERIDGSGVTIRKRGSVVVYPFGEAGGGGKDSFPPLSRGGAFIPPPLPNGVPYR